MDEKVAGIAKAAETAKAAGSAKAAGTATAPAKAAGTATAPACAAVPDSVSDNYSRTSSLLVPQTIPKK